MLNLVANAAKFTERGHIRVDVAWRPAVLDIGVEDTGPGIEPEACDRVFEEFEFGSPTAARAGGSGLGLSVSRRLARLMGGDLILASTTVGAGTRFLLTVPATAVAPLAEPASGTRRPRAACRAIPSASATPSPRATPRLPVAADWKPAILVCDDSPGHPPAAVGGPRSGRRRGHHGADRRGRRRRPWPRGGPTRCSSISACPGMSGLAVADHLRASGYDGPVIAVTGGGDELTPAALREQGFTDIVHKPTPGSVLVDVLAGHLPQWTPRRHRAGQAR